MLQTLPGLKSNNTDIFRMLLANNIPHFSSVHIKQYWYFQRVTGKQCTRFQKLDQTTLTFSESYWQTKLQTFPDFISLSNNTDIFRVTGKQYYKLFRVEVTQHWHFQKVTIKLYWLIQSSYPTVFTISQSCYQTMVNTFLRVSMDTWTDRKFSKRKFASKFAYTHEINWVLKLNPLNQKLKKVIKTI